MVKIILFVIIVAVIVAGAVFFQIYKSEPEEIQAPIIPQVKSPVKTIIEPGAATKTVPRLQQTDIEALLDAELAGLDADISDIGQYNQDASLNDMGSDISAVSQ